MNPDLQLKQQLHLLCLTKVRERIEGARLAMEGAQEAANAEEKSSAGDKYETGRAMAQIARDQAAQQLDDALKLKATLDQINPTISSPKIVLGSLIITDQNRFYISISAGELEWGNKKYFAVSAQSPIGKLLLNSYLKDVVVFNNKKLIIEQII